MSKSPQNHLARIDVLRGLAILMVFAVHAHGAVFGWTPFPWTKVANGDIPFPGWIFTLLQPMTLGRDGVALFFVISGYVIHRSYLRETTFSWARYAARRFWRIYPAYVLALALFAWWQHAGLSRNLVLHATLTHNLLPETFLGINGSFWSLAVEAHLYALYPLALWLRGRFGMHGMWMVVSGICILSTIQPWLTVPMSPLALWPSWLIGMHMAEAHLAGRPLFPHRRIAYVFSFFAYLASLVVCRMDFSPMRFLAAAGLWSVLMDGYVFRGLRMETQSPKFIAKWIAAIGTISYSLYLLHQPFLEPANSLLQAHGIAMPTVRLALLCVAYLPLAGMIAWLFYETIERGGIRLGKRLSTTPQKS